jgi:23S rRNA pseudouridine2605 synthase
MTTPKKAIKKSSKTTAKKSPVVKKTVKSEKTTKSKKITTRKPKAKPLPVPEVQLAQERAASEVEISGGHTAEILEDGSALYQGTTSVVPKAKAEKVRALAPETAASAADEAAAEADEELAPRPPAKLERLQKILAAAGVSSRRGAEAMIEQGRVQVNGKVVTVLGTKADAARDHIRVDGKLLQGAERHRYFVLNKPRGFVTTVKDPEGRPTVMQFFEKMKERLYPIGRLDYLSEGLLVVTNDGELANRLTKASSGVEKTYLVKVSGQPTEAELDKLRSGVSIALGAPGSRQIRTSPARVRQVRQGDNPWYEVVLIEGRNRELRKMFEEIGHFVEKIRRTGYGPLVLDQEPGSLRELQPEELAALRLAAEGKLRTPKAKELRRRNLLDAGLLPTVLPKPTVHPRPVTRPDTRPPFRPKFGADRTSRPARPADSFASGEANKFFRPPRPSAEGFRPAAGRTSAPNPVRSFSRSNDENPRRTGNAAPSFGFNRPAGRSFDSNSGRPDSRDSRPDSRQGTRQEFRPSNTRPAWKKDDRPARPPARFAAGSTGDSRPARPFTPKPAWKKPERPFADRSGQARPDRPTRPTGSGRPDRFAKPAFRRSAPPRREAPARNERVFDEDRTPIRPPNLHIEEITGPARSSFTRPTPSRPSFARPERGAGGLARPFTTSSGKPRPGGARPSSKPGAFTDRPKSTGWKPKSSFTPGKPAFKGKSGGKRPSGKPTGKKRSY